MTAGRVMWFLSQHHWFVISLKGILTNGLLSPPKNGRLWCFVVYYFLVANTEMWKCFVMRRFSTKYRAILYFVVFVTFRHLKHTKRRKFLQILTLLSILKYWITYIKLFYLFWCSNCLFFIIPIRKTKIGLRAPYIKFVATLRIQL